MVDFAVESLRMHMRQIRVSMSRYFVKATVFMNRRNF